jgi:predicted transposase/invertase (TIGR01784 family)
MRLDGVFVPTGPERPVHFVEVFFYRTSHAYSNLFAKVFLWLETNDPTKDWHACIIFASRRLEPDGKQPYQPLLSSDKVTRIYLDELPEPREDQLGLGILRMIASPAEQALLTARALLGRVQLGKRSVALRRKLIELIETIVLGHFPSLSREELEDMIQIKDFRETKVYQEALAEGREVEREEIAARLLAKGIPVSEVASLTDLPLARVRSLKKKQAKP